MGIDLIKNFRSYEFSDTEDKKHMIIVADMADNNMRPLDFSPTLLMYSERSSWGYSFANQIAQYLSAFDDGCIQTPSKTRISVYSFTKKIEDVINNPIPLKRLTLACSVYPPQQGSAVRFYVTPKWTNNRCETSLHSNKREVINRVEKTLDSIRNTKNGSFFSETLYYVEENQVVDALKVFQWRKEKLIEANCSLYLNPRI